jgi:hypothetical protein
LLARVNASLGVRLALRDVFDAPTIRELARRIGEMTPEAPASADTAHDEREEILI